jgi:hypothetical protein
MWRASPEVRGAGRELMVKHHGMSRPQAHLVAVREKTSADAFVATIA